MEKNIKPLWYENLFVSIIKALMIGGIVVGFIDKNKICLFLSAIAYVFLDYTQNKIK